LTALTFSDKLLYMTSRLKIYTKTGDEGKTRLVDGRECSKASPRVEAYGSVDELNSQLGLLMSEVKNSKHIRLNESLLFLESIQNQLFNLGSHIACEKEETRTYLPPLAEAWIEQIEQQIDQMDAELPELKNFILPGGSMAAALAHVSRTICRRSERQIVALIDQGAQGFELTFCLKYLNRLSDYLFVLARWINSQLQISDQIWKK
jgi:cob(I)alamin adenosyltransferase